VGALGGQPPRATRLGLAVVGIGVYASDGGLSGDAAGAGCNSGTAPVEVEQQVGVADAEITTQLADLSSWSPDQLATAEQQATLQAALDEIVEQGAAAVPSFAERIQSDGCNEAASPWIVQALGDLVASGAVSAAQAPGIADILLAAGVQGLDGRDPQEAGSPRPLSFCRGCRRDLDVISLPGDDRRSLD
jgi:hypothetical protein